MEAVVALSILAVGLLAMLGMQLQAVRQADWGRHTTDAGRVARDQLEMFSRMDWNDADLQDTNWTAVVAVNSDVDSVQGTFTEQVFNLQWRITTDPGNANLREIDVRVLWDEGDASGVGDQRRYAVSSMRYND
jgi:Tfp pilus assembly protein PilV